MIGSHYKKQGWHSRLVGGLCSGSLKFGSRISHPWLVSVLCSLSSFKYLGKEKISRKPLQLSRFLLVGLALNSCCYKLWQPNFWCFALNFVEAQDGMLFLSFLDENRRNILMDFRKAFTLFKHCNAREVHCQLSALAKSAYHYASLWWSGKRWKAVYNIN